MWNPQTKPMKKSLCSYGDAAGAFTLIELLVVISIITLLVSILLPSITRAKGLAKSVVCNANAKGIGTAMFMYADEWNELYPLASIEGRWGEYVQGVLPNVYSWMEQLFPYVESKKLYVCTEKPNGSEYSYFLGSRAAILDTGGYSPVIRSRIRYPSAHVLSGCTGLEFGDLASGRDDCDKDDYTQDCVDTGNKTITVHNGVQTILFPDNHVQSYPGYVEGEMTFRYDEMGPRKMEGDEVE